jgi:penicillin-binding protein 1A
MAVKNNIQPKKKNNKRKKIIWSVTGFATILVIVGSYLLYQYIIDGLPSLEQLENPKQSLATNVYSSDDVLIGQFFIENRIETNMDSLPKHLIDALIYTEDRKFYDHWGVDLDRFAKAMVKNLLSLSLSEGASTLTQQLSKNLFELKNVRESPFDKGVRKLREWITAVNIEKAYTKEEILEMYLNVSYFGNRAYGIEMASRVYFDKPAKNLSIEEGAVLIAMLKSWVYYNPFRRMENSLRRRNLVMYSMKEGGVISQAEYDSLKQTEIIVSKTRPSKNFTSTTAPHYVEYIRQQLEELSVDYGFNIYEDGLTVYTSLDTRMQDYAASAVIEHLENFQKTFDGSWTWEEKEDLLDEYINKAISNSKEYKTAPDKVAKTALYDSLKNNEAFVDSIKKHRTRIEAGFVALDVKTGEIRAMVGGRDQDFQYGLNHVTQIKRQPGSAFKAVIYTTAMENGLYPAYPILNQPFVIGEGDKAWAPRNFDRTTSGFMTLREALLDSKNLPTARLIVEDHIKLWQVGQVAEKMGIKTRLHLYKSIALGASEVTPLEMTSVYATLANHGIYTEPVSIIKIEDKNGVLIENFSPVSREAISEESAYLVTDMLKTVIDGGTGLRARVQHNFYRPAAGKTGTTDDYVDAWFLGYTPQIAAGAWVGFDDPRIKFTGSYGQGSRAALPIWAVFMRNAHDSLDLPVKTFDLPESGNIATVDFCKESIYELGSPRLASSDCKSGVVRDIIKLEDIPPLFNAEKDTTAILFAKYWTVDSTSHEMLEIIDSLETTDSLMTQKVLN